MSGHDEIVPSRISVADEVLADLQSRLRRTRWPEAAPGAPWSQGTDLVYLQGLVGDWADGFDWRVQEARLNRYHQFETDIGDARIHFVRISSGKPPLLLTHGWPSCFIEMLPLADLLREDFDLVIPSLPGYGYSTRPATVGVDARCTAELWLRLMDRLGYGCFGAVGGDFGAAVTTHLALIAPERLHGILLTTSEMSPVLGPESPALSDRERSYLDHVARWDQTERGYSAIQSTRPQTLGYALADSPAGLAAWLTEKWRSWSDSAGDLDAHFGRETVLTLLTFFWATNSITSSMRDYFDNRWHGTPLLDTDFVQTPTAMSVFAHEFVSEGEPPREWYERLYNITQWSTADHGGHFAALEAPEVLAEDIRTHFMHRQR